MRASDEGLRWQVICAVESGWLFGDGVGRSVAQEQVFPFTAGVVGDRVARFQPHINPPLFCDVHSSFLLSFSPSDDADTTLLTMNTVRTLAPAVLLASALFAPVQAAVYVCATKRVCCGA